MSAVIFKFVETLQEASSRDVEKCQSEGFDWQNITISVAAYFIVRTEMFFMESPPPQTLIPGSAPALPTVGMKKD